ncbi:unnamed protein product [Cylicocyclus nassatus]|uniref:Transmembrane protein n=1 Tax=Cylicocyclus nassatus TaxID=53992 RepID=A0AA36DQ24_CYLNA|nr:unnamed protein product [Cylicocyclus nassatus]
MMLAKPEPIQFGNIPAVFLITAAAFFVMVFFICAAVCYIDRRIVKEEERRRSEMTESRYSRSRSQYSESDIESG